RLAPGRVARWISWALAPAVATYRQFGLAAYLQDEAMWLHGRRIAGSQVCAIGECAVVASSFLAQFPANCVVVPSRDLEDGFPAPPGGAARLAIRPFLAARAGAQLPSGAELLVDRAYRAPDGAELGAIGDGGSDPENPAGEQSVLRADVLGDPAGGERPERRH